MSDSFPKFEFERFSLNPTGWGPTSTNNVKELALFGSLPFQPYNRADRIGRIIDWIGQTKKTDNRERYTDRFYGSSATAGMQFAYVHNDEEEDFQLAAKLVPQKPAFRPFRRLAQQKRNLPRQPDRFDYRFDAQNAKQKKSVVKEYNKAKKQWLSRGGGTRGMGRTMRRRFDERQPGQDRVASVQVRSDWKVVEELDFQRLMKLSLPSVGQGQDINDESYGTLHFYDKKIDSVSARKQIPLEKFHGVSFYSVTTIQDDVIKKLAHSNEGNVFATDIILATLMTATRSVSSWDILVNRLGNKLFFDKRDKEGYTNAIATNPPSYGITGINNAEDLSVEALYINQNFRRQVLLRSEAAYKCSHENAPFEINNAKAECAYRYRTWSLGNMDDGTPVKVVARTENDGIMLGPNREIQKLTIKAFNEWDSSLSGGTDWRSKIDVQKGAVLATEMKNNGCKLAKWTMQAILGASDYLKLGFVSRVAPNNSTQHAILGVQQVKPLEFASSINLNLDNCWGILRALIDFFMKQPDGEYLLLKDPLEPVVRVYLLPKQALDSDEEEVSDGSERGAA